MKVSYDKNITLTINEYEAERISGYLLDANQRYRIILSNDKEYEIYNFILSEIIRSNEEIIDKLK